MKRDPTLLDASLAVVNRNKIVKRESKIDTVPHIIVHKMASSPSAFEQGESGTVVKRPSLSLLQMLLLNAVVCGLEFCASAGFTYIPPLLLKSGLSEERMTFVIGFGPLLGLFFVPMLGKASDNSRSKYGRRRPFIFVLGIGCIISLLMIPCAQLMTDRVFGSAGIWRTSGILLLCAGVVLLDFTTQACLNPCEALLSDASKGTDQRDSIFTVYSFMISVGGCVGYFITAIDWKSNSVGIYFGSQEQSAFSLLIVLFSITMIATLLVAEEQPVSSKALTSSRQLPQEEMNSGMTSQAMLTFPDGLVGVSGHHHESGYETSSNSSLSDDGMNSPRSFSKDDKNTAASKSQSYGRILESMSVRPVCNIFSKNCNIPFRLRLLAYMRNRVKSLLHRISRYLPRSIRNFWNIPLVLKRLVVADFCSWTAVMGFNFFYTDFIGQSVYGGSPNAAENTQLRNLYDQGVRMGSWGLLFHCIVSAVFAPFVERLSHRFGPRRTFIFGMMSFTVAMFIMVVSRHITVVTMMAAATGFGYACVTIIPFTLVTEYHSEKEVYFFDSAASLPEAERSSRLENRGIAVDMAMLDSAYFSSEVVLSLVMGYIVHYTGTAAAYMVTAGAMGVMATLFLQRILTDKQEVISIIREIRQLQARHSERKAVAM